MNPKPKIRNKKLILQVIYNLKFPIKNSSYILQGLLDIDVSF